MNKLVFGTDPEFFASYTKDGKDYVLPPAFFRVYRDLEFTPNESHPIFIDDMDNSGVKVIEDGVAFEFTIRPSQNWKELHDRIQLGRKMTSDLILSKFNEDCETMLKALPTICFDVERWGKEKEEFQQCLIFGCDTSYDAWNEGESFPRVNAKKHPYRYGGMHIHISGREIIKEKPMLAIQMLTLTTGLAYVANSKVPELELLRTGMYGKPGNFRPQRYRELWDGIPYTDFGVEYRTPSNSMADNEEQCKEVFKWTKIGIDNLLPYDLGLDLIKKFAEDAKEAIVKCNQSLAGDILSYIETRI